MNNLYLKEDGSSRLPPYKHDSLIEQSKDIADLVARAILIEKSIQYTTQNINYEYLKPESGINEPRNN